MLSDEVMLALDRMCMPLDKSVLDGATAQADAECMRVIRSEMMRLDKDAERWRVLLKALRTRLPGPAHGSKIKVVEVCPMYGDEKDVDDLSATIDAAIRHQTPA